MPPGTATKLAVALLCQKYIRRCVAIDHTVDRLTCRPSQTTTQHDEEHRPMPKELASILIVDDDDDLRSAFGSLFADFGYKVRTAADGFSALAEMRSEPPDVLISDLNMPRMSGFELLSVVRERFPEIGVIAMSGAYSGNGVPRGVAADAFYPKGGASNSCLPELVDAIIGRDRSQTRRWVA